MLRQYCLVVSYLIKYQAQVAEYLGQMRMVEEAGPMLKHGSIVEECGGGEERAYPEDGG
jgi:hypothetical protein